MAPPVAAAPVADTSAEETLLTSWQPESTWSGAAQPNWVAASAAMDILSDAESAAEMPAYFDDSPMSADVSGGLAGVEALEELSYVS